VLKDWLKAKNRVAKSYKAFEVQDVTELGLPSQAVRTHLSDAVKAASVDIDFLADLTARLGWKKATAFVKQRLPAHNSARRGRFGEVLGVSFLREFHGYHVPIEKFVFAITGGQSQPSTDAVLIKVTRGIVSEVCLVESKLRTTTDKFAGVQGVRQLKADYEKEMPDMLGFTAARLYERDDALYRPFMEYMASRDDDRNRDSFCLFLIYDGNAWSDDVLTNIEDDEPTTSPLRVHATRVENLRKLVDEVFAEVGIRAEDDDD
jgi:hypothetical protein